MPPSEMEPPRGDGPDGSSLKPVSSLLARFENMNKIPLPASQAPSRPISPRPKPERLQNFKSTQDSAAPSPTTPHKSTARVEDTPLAASQPRGSSDGPPISRPSSTKPPKPLPPVSKLHTSIIQPPSVLIQPPQSPPKDKPSGHIRGDQSPFLDPESAAPSTTPKPIKLPPGRPLTPTPVFAAPRSPRLASSLPPSPPPPRRSAELRRDRDVKPAPPPPASRPDRSLATGAQQLFNLPDVGVQSSVRRGTIPSEASPFSSPPTSPGVDEEEKPPQLPTRPRPTQERQGHEKSKASLGGFAPPPVRHVPADRLRSRENEVNGYARDRSVADANGEPRRDLPARPQAQEQARYQPAVHAIKAPPRPPRANQTSELQTSEAVSSSGSIRPSPNHQAQLIPPPPARRHGRSQTAEKVSDQSLSDASRSVTPIPAPVKVTPATIAPEANAIPVEPVTHTVAYPDGANANRRPPYIKKGGYQIHTKYDPKSFDVCGELVVTSGQLTRVWHLSDDEQIMSLAHTEGTKATAVAFKPAADPDEEGARIWIGTSAGDVMEADLETGRVTCSKVGVHGRSEVTRIHRHYNELWTLDESGTLLVWGPHEDDAVPNLQGHPTQSYKVPKGHTFSMVIGDQLWHATARTIRVFLPTLDGRSPFQVLIRPLTVEGAGDVTSGTLIKTQPGKVFLGHVDGKISVWSTADYSCQGIFNISTWKINTLASAGRYLWAGYNTGKICIYHVERVPWIVLKEWQAHDNPVLRLKTDTASPYRVDQLQVVSLGSDNKVKIWDGLLQDDWVEDEMKSKDTKYCEFSDLSTLVMTWNAGASTPHSLRYSDQDATFIRDLLASSGSPDILVVGFQELVDLEDKTATAKRLLKSKKSHGSDQERMSHRYRDWRDYLLKCLDEYYAGDELYHLLHTAPLVGLFTCVFVKASLHGRIRNLQGAEVKRGMGGLHGNKGAVVVRFQVDDSSLCFVNCHLAAGQSQANARHADIAAILETGLFPAERDAGARIDNYTGGGDGSMILDHELCVINGDLNYRIDTMSRDTVVKAVKQDNLPKLLERDQLLVARRRNPVFRLRAFEELPITFAPTYKYDVGTDRYDTSEKRRSPAWCDRLLYRGRGRIQQLDYKRHEVRVSDHRPVSGNFRFWVKKVDPKKRATAWMESQQGFESVREKELKEDRLSYLLNTCGFDEATAKQLAKERTPPGRARGSGNRDGSRY